MEDHTQRTVRSRTVASHSELLTHARSSLGGPVLSAAAEERLLQASQMSTSSSRCSTPNSSIMRRSSLQQKSESLDERKRRLQEERDRRLVRAGLQPMTQANSSSRERPSSVCYNPSEAPSYLTTEEPRATEESKDELWNQSELDQQKKHAHPKLRINVEEGANSENSILAAQRLPEYTCSKSENSLEKPVVPQRPRLSNSSKAEIKTVITPTRARSVMSRVQHFESIARKRPQTAQPTASQRLRAATTQSNLESVRQLSHKDCEDNKTLAQEKGVRRNTTTTVSQPLHLQPIVSNNVQECEEEKSGYDDKAHGMSSKTYQSATTSQLAQLETVQSSKSEECKPLVSCPNLESDAQRFSFPATNTESSLKPRTEGGSSKESIAADINANNHETPILVDEDIFLSKTLRPMSSPELVSSPTFDDALIDSLQHSLDMAAQNRQTRSTSASSMPAKLSQRPTGASGVSTRASTGQVGTSRQQPESLLGRVLSHGINLALTQDKLQPQRRTRIDDFSHYVQHQPYLELSPGRSVQFRLTDWCPVVFRNFRKHQGIEAGDFQKSLCTEALRGGGEGGGKSGAIFFKSADQKLIVKEVRRSERETLLRILPSMIDHIATYRHSFLPRFLGLYTLEAIPDVLPQSLTIIIMTNILDFPYKEPSLLFNEVYDLKGSVHNRFTSSPSRPLMQQHIGTATPPMPRKNSTETAYTPGLQRPSLQRTNSSPPSESSPHPADETGFMNNCAEGTSPSISNPHTPKSCNNRPSTGFASPNAPRASFYSSASPDLRRGSTGTSTAGAKPFVLKDLNLRSRFGLGVKRKSLVMSQLKRDVAWLEKHNLMDYSFLLGVASAEKLDSPFVGAGPTANMAYADPMDTPKSGLESPSGARFSLLSSSPRFSDISSCKTTDSVEAFACEEEQAPSELGAILRRNRLQRQETACLLPPDTPVQLQLIGHGKAKRSRESSTIFRQSCTLYSFLISREMTRDEIEIAMESEDLDIENREVHWIVFRRYKDFERLQKGLQEELKSANSALRLPPLPRKQLIGFMEPEFVRRREQELVQWIDSILSLVNYRVDSPVLHDFLTNKANKCPPKWQADQSLQRIVQQRISSPVVFKARSLQRSSLTGGRRGSSLSKSSTCGAGGSIITQNTAPQALSSSVNTHSSAQSLVPTSAGEPSSSAAPASPELSQLMEPNKPSCLPLWETLGGEWHQSFDALRISNGTGRRETVKLFVGIIDILQEFNLSKKLESVFKGLTQHADGISAVDPERYGDRFLGFVDEFVFE